MKHENGTKVSYIPLEGYESQPRHTGEVIYFTTDGFHRVKWDEPNPDPDFFNTGVFFLPERLLPPQEKCYTYTCKSTEGLILTSNGKCSHCPECEKLLKMHDVACQEIGVEPWDETFVIFRAGYLACQKEYQLSNAVIGVFEALGQRRHRSQ